jgi:hypothetical protein
MNAGELTYQGALQRVAGSAWLGRDQLRATIYLHRVVIGAFPHTQPGCGKTSLGE